MNNVERLQYNEKAMKIYQSDLKKAIVKKDDFEIYLNLGNLLHWIIMTEEWHKVYNNRKDKYENNKKQKNMEGMMKAIRFANNSMKHNMMFRNLHITPNPVRYGSPQAICGTFYCRSEEVLWNNVANFKPRNNREQEQYECYNEYLRIKNVVNTLDLVVEFLIEETADYIFNIKKAIM